MDNMKIGSQIASLRKERGYTQESLAELLNISPQAVSKWENGRALPETSVLPLLAKALDTSIDSLLSDSQIQILSAYFGDGIKSYPVTNRLNRLIQNDTLALDVNAVTLACKTQGNRPSYLILKYQIHEETFYSFAKENASFVLTIKSGGYRLTEKAQIIAAAYGTAKANYDCMNKIEHFKVFGWSEYKANHELFPSDPASDETDFLTFVYLNQEGIHLVTCEEGESISYNEDKTDFYRKQLREEYMIPNIPLLPAFGEGQECSWAAALTAALQAMGVRTNYDHVMGVSGACYRLAFSSPGWDYSSVDGLVAYDYATPGYMAFGYVPKFANRVEKENRGKERGHILDEIRHKMPVLGINLRVAAEWGVICGYKNNGADLFCRTKYDGEVIDSQDYIKGKSNPYDYLFVDNWPFIITYFEGKTAVPSNKENLIRSLKVFTDGLTQHCDGYAMGFRAYETWIHDLLDEPWYRNNGDEQFSRRFSVNQFCSLALYDARKSAYAYLNKSKDLLPEQQTVMDDLVKCFAALSEKAEVIHKLLDSGEAIDGEKARRFWTTQMRKTQGGLLSQMLETEREAEALAKKIIC